MINRALPGKMIDLIRDGVSPQMLKEHGDRAVWNALVKTAASASQRGWECWEWEAEITTAKSNLGKQAQLKGNRKERSKLEFSKMLHRAWDAATAWVSTKPAPWDRGAARVEATRRAALLMTVVEDDDAALCDADRRVLAYAAAQAIERGMDCLALPWRAVAAATGLGERAVKNALLRLHKVGLLVLAVHGVSGLPSKRKTKANIYRLADADAVAAYQYRGTRSMGPPGQIYGTPTVSNLGTPGQIYGTPTGQVETQPTEQVNEESKLITITLSAADAIRLASALAELGIRAQAEVAVNGQQKPPDLLDNVRQLRAVT